MTLKDKWIKACEDTLNEYNLKIHRYTMTDCKICILANRTNQSGDILSTNQCIFGFCSNNIPQIPCTISKTFPTPKLRIRFYTILIGVLKTMNPQDFHAKNLHIITEKCKEIDELVWNAEQARNKNNE